ncbi:MAG: ASKHA domain-containing protein [Clostridiales Family XIII bacterium]|jgi:uncharacterized 2Fe-2S/4Fe-4S cluster protein (DUF4445 family)|nr:ASKHA domain-containing protein [Clostridiales Family XIII bacterium]
MKTTIFFPIENITAEADEGGNLLDVIRARGLPIEALCSGRGTCGKCGVLVNGEEALACRTKTRPGMEVRILSPPEKMEILTDSGAAADDEPIITETPAGAAAFAIDIGTTTVVIKAVRAQSGRELSVRAFTNPQRAYGADVLSRINHSMDDASVLSNLITDAVGAAIKDILLRTPVDPASVTKVVIAGNTTMSYILLNLRCRSLGLAPFQPEFALSPRYTYREVFGSEALACPVFVYPYISAFVGGDIVSGLVNIERHRTQGGATQGDGSSATQGDGSSVLDNTDEPSPCVSYMLVDMGTNGEIVYRKGERVLATSTAAGPALEGGNISCGMSGVEGAIYAVRFEDGAFACETIGGVPAKGVCGSGVIDLMAKLLAVGLIEATGALADKDVREITVAPAADGRAAVVFTQKDVREFQLAKGAIRAGIDILIKEMGGPPDVLYLAGGFGQNISIESALDVGLLPEAVRGRVEFAGNTSLGGCEDARAGEGLPREAADMIARAEEINLAAHKDFNNTFMESMMF